MMRPRRNKYAINGVLYRIGRIAALLMSVVQAQASIADPSLEQRVKAAFIYNFTKFISWPDERFEAADSPINLCVAGDRDVETLLATAITGKTSQNRPLQSLFVRQQDQLSACHLLYITNGESPENYWVDRSGDLSIITVGDYPDFIDRGGIVGFSSDNGKIRFVINQSNALKQQLRISSKLLSLAQRVEH